MSTSPPEGKPVPETNTFEVGGATLDDRVMAGWLKPAVSSDTKMKQHNTTCFPSRSRLSLSMAILLTLAPRFADPGLAYAGTCGALGQQIHERLALAREWLPLFVSAKRSRPL